MFAGVSYALPGGHPARPQVVPEPRPPENGARPEPPAGPAAPDADKDGIEDRLDRCPNEPEPAANGGCPDRDQDKDCLVDRLDKCPQQSGPKESSGCPLLDIGETSIALALPLKFQPGSAELAPGSRPTIAALVTTWRATPTIKRVLFDVTASGTSHHATRKLAARRARALSELLVEAGAPAELLVIRPLSEFGPDEITRVELVREATPVRPEPTRARPDRAREICAPGPPPPQPVGSWRQRGRRRKYFQAPPKVPPRKR